ncbi:MAG TPA: hypothetical protein PK771_03810, partial [Spirochaetota bacterium]|nr:hypothetical protein [Spirochaetota bacterium]
MKNRFLLVIFMFFSLCLYSEQLKLLGNLFMLSVSEEDGRFIIYQRGSKQEKWKPLIFEDFPSTTYFRFFDKNLKIIDFGLGGKNNYSEAKIVDNTIVYFWQNKEVKIKIIYTLVSSKIGESSDSLLIDLTIINLNDANLNLSYFLCIDTYLGEKSNQHLFLPGNVLVNEEKE